MNIPNLFQIAPKDITHGTFIAWLINWADPHYNKNYPQLHSCATEFVRMLVGRHGAIHTENLQINNVEALANNNIWAAVNAKVNDNLCIHIVYRTKSGPHDNQFEQCRVDIAGWCRAIGRQLVPIYLCLDIETIEEQRNIENQGFAVVPRDELIEFFDKFNIESRVTEYMEHITNTQNRLQVFESLPIDSWGTEQWEGFSQFLATKFNGEHLVFSQSKRPPLWTPLTWNGYHVYLEVDPKGAEEERSYNLRLKIDVRETDQRGISRLWRQRIFNRVNNSQEFDGTIIHPKLPIRYNDRHVSVAIVKPENWLGDLNHPIDINRVVERLRLYRRFLEECANE
jgi:hypothetical protein